MGMLAMRLAGDEAPDAVFARDAVRKPAFDEPVEHSVQRHPIELFRQTALDVLARERLLRRDQRGEHAHARRGDARARGTQPVVRRA